MMDARELNEFMLHAFPELKDEFDTYTSWQDGEDTGCFLTYEDLLLPFARKALQARDMATLERVANFIEDLLALDDEYAENLATVALLEGLKADGDDILPLLGNRSLAIYETLES